MIKTVPKCLIKSRAIKMHIGVCNIQAKSSPTPMFWYNAMAINFLKQATWSQGPCKVVRMDSKPLRVSNIILYQTDMAALTGVSHRGLPAPCASCSFSDCQTSSWGAVGRGIETRSDHDHAAHEKDTAMARQNIKRRRLPQVSPGWDEWSISKN